MENLEYKIEASRRDGILFLECSGIFAKGAFAHLVEIVVAQRRMDARIDRCLADLRKIESRVSAVERFELAKLAAEKLPDFKMASLAAKGSVKSRLYEDAANNRGLATLVTDDEQELLAWLRSD